MLEPRPHEPVGQAEIARLLGVKIETVYIWKHRGLLPELDWGPPAQRSWRWKTIKRWAIETGRLDQREGVTL